MAANNSHRVDASLPLVPPPGTFAPMLRCNKMETRVLVAYALILLLAMMAGGWWLYVRHRRRSKAAPRRPFDRQEWLIPADPRPREMID